MRVNLETMITPESLGRLIEDHIERNKVYGDQYQEKLAAELGISRPTLLKLRRGEEVRMTRTNYKKICDYFF